jgi:hypothetical protein
MYSSAGIVTRIRAECSRKRRPIISKENSLVSSLKAWNSFWGLPSLLFKGYKRVLWVNWPWSETGHIAILVPGFKMLEYYIHYPIWLHIVHRTALPFWHYLRIQSCAPRAENTFPSDIGNKNYIHATCLTITSSWFYNFNNILWKDFKVSIWKYICKIGMYFLLYFI